MVAFIDLSGKKFGRLTAVRRGPTRAKMIYWECICDCGNAREIIGSALRYGHTKSCGCISSEILELRNTTHGMSKTPAYKIWKEVHKRCYNPKSKIFEYYGGRGISVCERWNSFENFFTDMGERPSSDHSIERLDVNGNYEPSNCKWATKIEQMNNRRDSVYIDTPNGRQTVANAARAVGLKAATLHYRIRHKFPSDKLFEPVQ